MVMTALCLPALRRSPASSLRAVRLATAAGGNAFVLYLARAELYKIDTICLWCTAVHILTAALFGVIAVGTALLPAAPPRSPGNRRLRGAGAYVATGPSEV
jgi:uncharacterized membrane protein